MRALKRATKTQTLPLSGMEEIEEAPNNGLSEFPSDWSAAQLSEVVEFSAKPRGLNLSEYERIPFIPMELIPDSGPGSSGHVLLRPAEIRSGTYFRESDILLAKITPSFENGKQGFADDLPLPFGYASTEVYPIHPLPDRLDRLFLFYYLRLPRVRVDIAGKMEGTTGRQRVPKSVLERLVVPLPPLAEQRAIAHVLGTVQRAIEASERVLVATRELKRSLMRYLFTYGPVPLDQAERVALKETEVGWVPEGWQITIIGAVCSVKASFPSFDSLSRLDTGNLDDELVLALKVSDMNLGINSKVISTANNSFRCDRGLLASKGGYLRPGAIVFPKRGAAIATNKKRILAKWAILDPNLIGIEPRGVDGEFLLASLERVNLAALQDNTTVPQLNKSHVQRIPIPLPSLLEQSSIAQYIGTLDSQIAANGQRKQALEALFQSLLHHLMTGKVRVKTA